MPETETDTLDKPIRLFWYATEGSTGFDFQDGSTEAMNGCPAIKGVHLTITSRRVLRDLAKDINDKLEALQ